jgi:hypothetical protein
VRSAQTYKRERSCAVCFLSAEHLPGPHRGNKLLTLGIMEEAREAMRRAGVDLDPLIKSEVSPGLGNGGLGWLSANRCRASLPLICRFMGRFIPKPAPWPTRATRPLPPFTCRAESGGKRRLPVVRP